MRLLYAYYDFLGLHQMGECSLNFSTTEKYSIKKDGNIYILGKSALEESDRIPADFWGDKRLYNITSLVGDNGSGKSSILHNIIKSIVNGLSPDVPFIFVIQATQSEKITAYYGPTNSNYVFTSSDSNFVPIKMAEYPNDLRKVKCILLDNTLSLSSFGLSYSYSKVVSDYNPGDWPEVCIVPQTKKQFYNASLAAAIQYSNDICSVERESYSDSLQNSYVPAHDYLANHFQYETYQEIRFLFDRQYWDVIREVEATGQTFPIPKPDRLYISIASAESLGKNYGTTPRRIPYFGNRNIFILQLFEAVYCCLCNELSKESVFAPVKICDALLQIFDTVSTPQEIKNAFKQIRSRFGSSEADFQAFEDFLCFVLNNEKTLLELFQPISFTGSPIETCNEITAELLPSFDKALYYVKIDDVINERNLTNTGTSSRQRCFMEFLDRYRLVSNRFYFLSFSAGLSSGEKNILRMLTQFRYAIDGPIVYSENTAEDEENRIGLRNVFFGSAFSHEFCDTLFVFLDEADLTYHPEWQRNFISLLTAFLPKLIRDPYRADDNEGPGCKDIQVFLATHSPLMLGDFPKVCTIHLKRNGGVAEVDSSPWQSSFGQNLYTILKDGFFMDDTIGEFAKQKINTVVEWCRDMRPELQDIREKEKKQGKPLSAPEIDILEKSKVDLNKHRRIVDLLPPGIIRNKLNTELDSCAQLIYDKKDKREMLNSEKARLEKQLKRVNKELETLQQESAGGNNASDQ